MDELLYKVRDIFKTYLHAEGCEYYNIPEYQRGYKWTADTVTQLLEDLKAFNCTVPGAFYCLQNITVTKSKDNETGKYCMNVIDGQQRLTTLFILLSYLQRNEKVKTLLPSTEILKYSVRKSTHDFLQTDVLTGNLWSDNYVYDENDTKDQYYIKEVAKAIDVWFAKGNSEDALRPIILDNLKLIVNRVDSGEEETIFASLNGGKVDLDGADLVRAILITRAAKEKYPLESATKKELMMLSNDDLDINVNISVSSLGKINEYRIKLGIDLDEMNRWWSDRIVRNYFVQLLPDRIKTNKAFKHNDYPIDLLYYAFYETHKTSKDKDERDMDLRFFENGIDFDGDASNDHFELYQKVHDFHLTMMDWYNDDETYNLIGYLLYNFKNERTKVSFSGIWEIWQNCTSKSDFKERLKNVVKLQIANGYSPDSEDTIEDKLVAFRRSILDISEDWYNNGFLWNLLPLLDILPIKKRQGNVEKTIFKRVDEAYLHRLNKDSVNTEDREHVRSQTRPVDPEHCTEEERLLLDEENRKGLNSIGNLVLLHQKINRGYRNSEHTLKMDSIASEFMVHDVFIRPHTFRVFMSKLSNMKENGIESDNIYWSEQDIINNVKDIDERITRYLGLPEIPQNFNEE